MGRSFEELVSEAAAAPIDGWDFSWLLDRATEERPSWGYQHLMSQRLATASAALDIDTGGGEVLSEAPVFPATMAATESWPPNSALATALLHPRGVVVVATRGSDVTLPFADAAFDLVTSRHATEVRWGEIARVLRPDGTYLAQQIGPATMRELFEYFLGPQPARWSELQPDTQTARAQAAGMQVLQMRLERMRAEFFDVGAVVYFLRKVIWTVPGFTVDRYRERLRDMHTQIEENGPFVAYSTRVLVEAHKPDVRRSHHEHGDDG